MGMVMEMCVTYPGGPKWIYVTGMLTLWAMGGYGWSPDVKAGKTHLEILIYIYRPEMAVTPLKTNILKF
jgi:hypothetical protein